MHIQDFEIASLPRNQKAYALYDVASRPDGSMWRVPVCTITSAQEGPTFVVIGGVHGDEYEGPETIANVYQQLSPGDLTRGNLVMVPFFNLPAWEAGTRSSPVDGLNLARVMPGNPHGSISQQLAYYATHKFIDPSDLFLDIHSGGVNSNVCTSIYYYVADNEIGRKTAAAAKAFAAPVVIGSTSPSTVVYGCSFRTCWDRGKAGLFTEAHGAGRTLPEEIECFTTGVLNMLKHMGMMDGETDTRRTTHHLQGITHFAQGDDKRGFNYEASVAGYFKPAVRIMDHITVGQRLGAVLDFSGATLEEFVATRAGYVITLRAVPRISVGDTVICIMDGEAV